MGGRFEIIKDDSELTAQSKKLLGNRLQAAFLVVFQHARCETTQAGHDLGPMISSNPASILIERMQVVKNAMGSIDRPVTSVDLQQLLGDGFLQTEGSHTADELSRILFFPFASMTLLCTTNASSPSKHKSIAGVLRHKFGSDCSGWGTQSK